MLHPRLLAVAPLLAISACGGLQFHNDHRLRFTAPRADSSVKSPLTLSWTMKDLPAGASYAVFVDRAPVRSGEALPKDLTYTVVTPSPTVTITTLAKDPYDSDSHEHVVTVVLVDAAGKRIGESAWRREFKVKGETA